MIKKVLSKDQRISAEIKRLQVIFEDIPPGQKQTVAGLIERVGYLRISLQDLEQDLNENGMTELFSQSDKNTPYPRERPEARQYVQLLKTYQSGMKQLIGLLPDKMPPIDDGFEEFNNSRD